VEVERGMKDEATKCQVEVEVEAYKVDRKHKLEVLGALMRSFEEDEVQPELWTDVTFQTSVLLLLDKHRS
jgi:hypothetical protein